MGLLSWDTFKWFDKIHFCDIAKLSLKNQSSPLVSILWNLVLSQIFAKSLTPNLANRKRYGRIPRLQLLLVWNDLHIHFLEEGKEEKVCHSGSRLDIELHHPRPNYMQQQDIRLRFIFLSFSYETLSYVYSKNDLWLEMPKCIVGARARSFQQFKCTVLLELWGKRQEEDQLSCSTAVESCIVNLLARECDDNPGRAGSETVGLG